MPGGYRAEDFKVGQVWAFCGSCWAPCGTCRCEKHPPAVDLRCSSIDAHLGIVTFDTGRPGDGRVVYKVEPMRQLSDRYVTVPEGVPVLRGYRCRYCRRRFAEDDDSLRGFPMGIKEQLLALSSCGSCFTGPMPVVPAPSSILAEIAAADAAEAKPPGRRILDPDSATGFVPAEYEGMVRAAMVPAEPLVLEWCRCGCGGEGRCLSVNCHDEDITMRKDILAVMRQPLVTR